jgi:hypothetical protein
MFFRNINVVEDIIVNKLIDFNNKFSKYTKNYILLIIFHLPNKPT